MASSSPALSSVELAAALSKARAALGPLYADHRDEEARKRRRWEDEQPMLESYIVALESTREILKQEQVQIHAQITQIAEAQARREAAAAAAAAAAPLPSAGGGAPAAGASRSTDGGDAAAAAAVAAGSSDMLAGRDSVDLATQLAELQGRLRSLDTELAEVRPLLQPGAARPEERTLAETKLVVLQDTRRLLQEESATVHAELQRRDAAARHKKDAERAEELASAGDLGRLQEQLAAAEAKLDRAKQLCYFPEAEGFRFRGGSGGVFFAAKDLHVAEISASVSLSLQRCSGAGGRPVARLSVTLSGASAGAATAVDAGSAGATGGSVGSAVAAAEAARAAAAERAEDARRAAVKAAKAAGGGSASGAGSKSSKGGGGGGSWADDPRQFAGGKGRRVAKLLDGLSSRTEQLKERLAAATAPPHGAHGDTPGAHVRSGLNRIASAFSDRGRSASLTQDGSTAVPGSAAESLDGGSSAARGGGAAAAAAAAAAAPVAPRVVGSPGAGNSLGPPKGSAGSSGLGEALDRMSLDGHTAAELKQKLSSSVETAKARFGGLGRNLKDRLEKLDAKVAEKVADSGRNLKDRLEKLDAKVAERVADSKALSEAKSRLTGGAASFKRHLNAAVDRLSADGMHLSPGQSPQLPSGGSGSHPSPLTLGAAAPGGVPPLLAGGAAQAAGREAAGEAHLASVEEEEGSPEGERAAVGQLADNQQQQQQEKEKETQASQEGVEGRRQQQQQQQQAAEEEGEALASEGPAASTEEPPTADEPPSDQIEADQTEDETEGEESEEESEEGSEEEDSSAFDIPSSEAEGGGIGLPGSTSISGSFAGSSSADGGGPNLQRSASAASTGAAPAGSTLGSFVEDAGSSGGVPSRRGVYVTLLGEAVEVIGEKGTKVPNISIREIALEVEAAFTATFEYDPLLGWQAPERVSFEVLSLNRRVSGSNIPLPKTLIKSLLNIAMPPVFTRLLLAALPHELGQYIVASGQGVSVAGEVAVAGPSLAAMAANLALAPEDAPRGRADVTAFARELRASQRARAMLGIPDGAIWRALAPLFSPGPACLLPDARPGPLTAAHLCRFASTIATSTAWPAIAAAWQPAINAAVAASAAQAGLSPAPAAPDLAGLISGAVAALARKPVRVAVSVTRVDVGLEAGAALGALRDYLERAAREFAANAKGEDALLLLQRPLSVQLESLDLWHATLQAALRRFSSRFVGAACGVTASADSGRFRLGLEGLQYEGPVKLQLPMDVLMGPDHSFLFALRLPDPKRAATNLGTRLRYVLDRVSLAAFGVTAAQVEAAAAAAASTDGAAGVGDEAASNGNGSSLDDGSGGNGWPAVAAQGARTSFDEGSAGMRRAAALRSASLGSNTASAAGSASGAAATAGLPGGLARSASTGTVAGGNGAAAAGPPLLSDPTIGHLALRCVAVALKLDERRVAELLQGDLQGADPSVVSSLLACFGDLARADLAPRWPTDAEHAAAAAAGEPAPTPRCFVTVATNDVTRARLDLESLAFESAVAPRTAVRLLHAFCVAAAEKFFGATGKRLSWLEALFFYLEEYLGRDSLRLEIAARARAEAASDDRLLLRFSALAGAASGGPAGGGRGGAAARRSGSAGGGGSEGGGGPALRLVNEVDLLTVLDTVQVLASVG